VLEKLTKVSSIVAERLALSGHMLTVILYICCLNLQMLSKKKKPTPSLYVPTANSTCLDWPVVSDVQVET